MTGKNLFDPSVTKSYERRALGQPCVFISHRQTDTNAAKALSSYLRRMDIDVYLDEDDRFLAAATTSGDAQSIVRYIETGITISTHLLGIISPNTKGSWWVPFEIGSARRKELSIAYLLLNNVDYLPEYLQIAHHIKDQVDLRQWVKTEIGRELRSIMKSVDSTLPDIPGLPRLRPQPLGFMRQG